MSTRRSDLKDGWEIGSFLHDELRNAGFSAECNLLKRLLSDEVFLPYLNEEPKPPKMDEDEYDLD